MVSACATRLSDTAGMVEPVNDAYVLAHRVAENIDDDLAGWIALERRKFVRNIVFDADVLEPDGIEHA